MALALSSLLSLAAFVAHTPPRSLPRSPPLTRLQLSPDVPRPDVAVALDPEHHHAGALPIIKELETPELALECLIADIVDPDLTAGIVSEDTTTSTFEFECPNSAPIDPSTGLLPLGIELPVPIPANVPGIELPSPEPARTELPSLKDLAAFCLPTLGIWLSSPLLSLIDTSVVRAASKPAAPAHSRARAREHT